MEKFDISKKLKKLLTIIILLLFITVLILIVEGNHNDNINSIFDAVWFLFVTISTVGYGDIYPTTFIGRFLTLVLIFFTPILLVQIFNIVIEVLNGKLIPEINLIFKSNKRWYVFDELNDESASLIADIIIKNSGDVVIICKKIVSDKENEDYKYLIDNKKVFLYDIDYEVCIKGKNECKIFLMNKGSELSKINIANKIEETSRSLKKETYIYVTSSHYTHFLSNHIHIINKNQIMAQVFMNKYNKEFSDEKILIVGSEELFEYIFEKVIVNNVYDNNQKNEYYIYNEDINFSAKYDNLLKYINDNNKSNFADKIFLLNNIYENSILLKEIDTIILCYEESNKNLEILNSINKFFIENVEVYIKSDILVKLNKENIHLFGDNKEIFTTNNILNDELFKQAFDMNEHYKNKYGGKEWNDLSNFKKESNISSCNHITMKKKILNRFSIRNYNDLLNISKDKKNLLLSIEHERWYRFHLIYNFEYNLQPNENKRQHNLLIPFEKLNDIDKEKNIEAYEYIYKRHDN